jgi:hypothetical protein
LSSDGLAELEAKLKAVQECRHIESALDRCKFGILNRATVYRLMACNDYNSDPHGGHGAERSVEVVFTPEESGRLFDLSSEMLTARLEELKAGLGL